MKLGASHVDQAMGGKPLVARSRLVNKDQDREFERQIVSLIQRDHKEFSAAGAKRLAHFLIEMIASSRGLFTPSPHDLAKVVKTHHGIAHKAGLLLNEYGLEEDGEDVAAGLSFSDFLAKAKKVGSVASKVGKAALAASPAVFDVARALGAKGKVFDAAEQYTGMAKDLTGSAYLV